MLGVKTTAKVQLEPAVSAPPQGLVPEPETDQSVLAVNVRFTVLLDELVAVTFFGKLENPSAGLSKSKLVGLKVTGKVGPPVPVPLRLVICGMKLEPLTMNDPLMAPAWVGLMVTETVHDANAARVPLQGAVPDPTAL